MDYYTNQSYYDVLGVKQDATLESIQKAKDRLKFGDSDNRAPFSMWAKIDEAYNVLSDPLKRREYDKKLEEDIDIYSHSNHGSSSNSGSDDNNLSDDQKNNGSNNNNGDNSSNNDDNKNNNGSNGDDSKNNEDDDKNKNNNGSNNSGNNTSEEEYDLAYISEFKPKEKTKNIKAPDSKLKTFGKYLGGTLAGYLVAGPIGAVTIPVWMKTRKKIKLKKDKNPKEITQILTLEINEIQKYNETLNTEINKLLSEPHNNYKLEINRIKYANQIELLEKLLDIKLSKKVKRTEMLKQKLDVVSTKMQLETAKKNLVKIQSKINEYEKEQGLSKVNKQLIRVNQQIAEQKNVKSFSVKKLEAYQTRVLNKRDLKAKRIKTKVVKSGKVYDSLLKAKDFVIALPYIFKSSEKLDEFMNEEIQRTR